MSKFWRTVIGSLRSGVIIVDQEFRVVVWNSRSADLWGLRADEVEGKNLLSLDIGLPVEKLKPAIRAALVVSPDADPTSLKLAATNRRGRAIECVVTVAPLAEPEKKKTSAATAGVIVMIDTPAEGSSGPG